MSPGWENKWMLGNELVWCRDSLCVCVRCSDNNVTLNYYCNKMRSVKQLDVRAGRVSGAASGPRRPLSDVTGVCLFFYLYFRDIPTRRRQPVYCCSYVLCTTSRSQTMRRVSSLSTDGFLLYSLCYRLFPTVLVL